jgi:hypothetical protein
MGSREKANPMKNECQSLIWLYQLISLDSSATISFSGHQHVKGFLDKSVLAGSSIALNKLYLAGLPRAFDIFPISPTLSPLNYYRYYEVSFPLWLPLLMFCLLCKDVNLTPRASLALLSERIPLSSFSGMSEALVLKVLGLGG